MEEKFGRMNHEPPSRPEGEVSVKHKKSQRKGNKSDDGEYVDFEEID